MSDFSYKIEFRCSECTDLSLTSTFSAYSKISVKDMFVECEKEGKTCRKCGKKMTFSMLEIKSNEFLKDYLEISSDNLKNDMYEINIECNNCKTRWSVIRNLNKKNQKMDDNGLQSMGIVCVNPYCTGKPKLDINKNKLTVKSLHKI